MAIVRQRSRRRVPGIARHTVRRRVVLLATAFAVAGSWGCSRGPASQAVGSDPVDVVHFTTRDAQGRSHTRSRHQTQPPSPSAHTHFRRARPPQLSANEKLHPRLQMLLTSAPPDSQLRLIVSFRDTVRIPVFPRGDTHKARTSGSNTAIRLTTDSLIHGLNLSRAAGYAQDSTALANIPGVTIRGRFWLIQALVVDAPVSAVLPIAGDSLVTYVRPVVAGEPPPDVCCGGSATNCTNTDAKDDPAAAIIAIGGGDLMNANYGGSWLGVLDTGVYTDHVLLRNTFDPSAGHVRFYKCLEACPIACPQDATTCDDCPDGNPGDPCAEGHGTSTAAILDGNDSAYPAYQGMLAPAIAAAGSTEPMDWFSVYENGCSPQSLNACAAVRALEFAIRRRDPVIIAEVAAEADPGVVRDPIDRAAAHAFDSGSAVVAAAGNDAGPVTGPAREATVIGVGARYPQNWLADTPTKPFQRFGAVDGRFKPEILGPTRTETAANCGDHAFTWFSHTSGATPYVGGAAAMINDWLALTFKVSDAGQTYAHLILSGSLQGPFTDPEWGGAGLLGLPPLSSLTWVGKAEMMGGPPSEYDLIPDPGAATNVTSLDAALWWPESMRDDGTRPHRRVKLELLDVNGNICGTSDDANNVFQRISVPASQLGPDSVRRLVWRWVDIHFLWFHFRLRLPTGLTAYRRIRITGPGATELNGETQTVYWAVAGRR